MYATFEYLNNNIFANEVIDRLLDASIRTLRRNVNFEFSEDQAR